MYKRSFVFGWGKLCSFFILILFINGNYLFSGFPVLIVGVSFGLKRDQYGAYDYCFLTHHDYLIYAFVGPMVVILLFNLTIFLKAFGAMTSKDRDTILHKKVNKDRLRIARSGLKATAVLLPILGLTWGIGVFAIDTLSLTLAYAFTILNSLQGFFVFVFHCLLNKKIQKAIRKVLKKRSNMNSLPNSNGRGTSGSSIAASLPRPGGNIHSQNVELEAPKNDSERKTSTSQVDFNERHIENVEPAVPSITCKLYWKSSSDRSQVYRQSFGGPLA
jgi:hypothetical protein